MPLGTHIEWISSIIETTFLPYCSQEMAWLDNLGKIKIRKKGFGCTLGDYISFKWAPNRTPFCSIYFFRYTYTNRAHMYTNTRRYTCSLYTSVYIVFALNIHHFLDHIKPRVFDRITQFVCSNYVTREDVWYIFFLLTSSRLRHWLWKKKRRQIFMIRHAARYADWRNDSKGWIGYVSSGEMCRIFMTRWVTLRWCLHGNDEIGLSFPYSMHDEKNF